MVTIPFSHTNLLFSAANTAFKGCIFRVEFDNHWPLKRMFQEPRPDFVRVDPGSVSLDRVALDPFASIREERCGFEEILPDPEPLEIRCVGSCLLISFAHTMYSCVCVFHNLHQFQLGSQICPDFNYPAAITV